MTKTEALNRLLANRDDVKALERLLDEQAAKKWRELSRAGRLPADTLAAVLKVFAESSSSVNEGRTVPKAVLNRVADRVVADAARLLEITVLSEEITATARRT